MNESTSSTPTNAPTNAPGSGDEWSPGETEQISTPRSGLGRIFQTVLSGIPTAAVLMLLAGFAYWGHDRGWKLPRFSELSGASKTEEVLWCAEHGVAEADCIACHASLMPKSELRGWCKEHGVHECVLHHPEISQLKEVPQISQDDLQRASLAIAARPRTRNEPGCKMHLRRIQFPSIDSVDRAGVDIGLVDRGPIVETIKVTGEIVYDPTRVAHLSSRATGTIWQVQKNIGDTVIKGDVMAIVDAVEVGQAKSKLLEELVELERASKSLVRLTRLGSNAIAAKEIEQSRAIKMAADVAVANAAQWLSNLGLSIRPEQYLGQPIDNVRNRLQFLGLPESMHETLGTSSSLLPVFASRDGVVVKRNSVAGEVVETGKPLFTVVDASQVWLQLNIQLEEVSRVAIGQKVIFRPDGSNQEEMGTVSWISTSVDPETRTVQARGKLDNAYGRLRDETFGSGEIVLREEPDAIVVPSEAIHWEGCCHVAFVRDKDYFTEGSYKVFHTRSVRPGASMDGYTEVIAGLLPGEVIVTRGSGIMRAELLKGNLGAG